MRIWIASVAAVAVQPLVLIVRIAPDYVFSSQIFYFYGFCLALLSVLVVAAAAVLILGISTFLLLRKFHCEGWASLGIAGFLLGALPTAVALSWPGHIETYSSSLTWHGLLVDTYVNGAPTIYAWLTYIENVMFFGLHGLVGALVFYAVWRRLAHNKLED